MSGNPFDFSGEGGGFEGLEGLGLEGLMGPSGLPADPAVLERNLVALSGRNRALAQRIAGAVSRAGVVLETGADGVVTGTLEGRRLGSARRAGAEAEKLAESVDPAECAAACVMGFGLGHHVRALQGRLGMKSLVVVFEPDVGLLRAVLERVDHSGWLALGRCVIATDAEDAAGLTRSIRGMEGLIALGVRIIEHAPSRARLGDDAARFGRTMGEVVRSTRTHVVTTLVHAPVTLRNMVMNADRYASCAGITALKNACVGVPAVTVAAGPSLQKNLALLGEPGVRERVVIIAAQTVLKPMLAAGIRPHFVTALDHHELSGRFYEGLTAEDVRGVRLVVEPKANPAILEKFPGEILVTREKVLDDLIGTDLVRDLGELPAGATVAHLSYYLARYLGCDPVIMIGQDLGFTDGQYYAAGAAIHRVWQGELNHERSLEMLEWERVARMRANLRRVASQDGRPIYTDEQMATYLAQFEAEFQKDTLAGLAVIDATEGGAAKKHTTAMPLREALERFAGAERPALPETAGGARETASVREALRAHFERLIVDAGAIRAASDETAERLTEIAESRVDTRGANAIVAEVQATGHRVRAMKPAFPLVEFINQTGVLNRFKADRLIELAGDDPLERQRRQAERDIQNVRWIGQAADELARQVAQGIAVLDGSRSKATRDEPEPEASVGREPVRAEVFVLCDPGYGGLGVARDLGEPVWRGRDALDLTLRRALLCGRGSSVRVLTPDPRKTAELLRRAGLDAEPRVVVEAVDPARWRERARAIGRARACASDGWRGGVAQTTVFDEMLDPKTVGEIMDRRGVDAAALIGADWALVDPVLMDALIDRHAEAPDRHQIAFSQAAPGLGGCVLSRSAVRSLEQLQDIGSPLGTVGGLLGYVPVNTQTDPIGTTLCVKVEPAVRDAGVRLIADAAPGRRLIASALERLGERAGDSSALQSVRAVEMSRAFAVPRTLVLELCPGRLSSGVFGAWKRGGPRPTERGAVDFARAHALLRELTTAREDAVVVFDGPGDPMMHPGALDFVRLADELGAACVSLRTDLLREGVEPEEIFESGLGVLSVDVLATEPATYAALTGVDRHRSVMERLGRIADARAMGETGLKSPWIQPRMTRCDAVIDQVEAFYDAWIMTVGSAVIDPQPVWVSDRVRPLPVPEGRALQIERDTLRVRSDGVVCDASWRAVRQLNAFDEGLAGAVRAWRAVLEHGDRRRIAAGAAA